MIEIAHKVSACIWWTGSINQTHETLEVAKSYVARKILLDRDVHINTVSFATEVEYQAVSS